MRVLMTGVSGNIGRDILMAVREAGYTVRTFDRAAQPKDDDWEHIPGDLRDIASVRRAAQKMDAVVHMGAISHDRYGTPEDIFAVNVQGTLNVLLAGAEAGVERVVYYSSVNALGNFQGHRTTEYFPIRDDYPRHPMSAYQLSKHLGEEACRSFTNNYDLTTICLRPVYVARAKEYAHWGTPAWQQRQEEMWFKQDYWSYVDIRDVCDATLRALRIEGVGHDAFLLCAADTMMLKPTAELIDRHFPAVPWEADREAYLAENPYRSLVDCSNAAEALGWQPQHSWRDEKT